MSDYALLFILAELIKQSMTTDEINCLEQEIMGRIKNMDELTAALYYRNGYLNDMRLEKAENTIRKARDEARKK